MSAAITAFLAIIAQVAPTLGVPSIITQIIVALENLVPFIIKEIQEAAPLVQNIIDALRGNKVITPEQTASLDALEARIDAEFEAAAAMPDSDGMAQ